jgi:hypothetical protein
MTKVGGLAATLVDASAFDIVEVASVLPARAACMYGRMVLPKEDERKLT